MSPFCGSCANGPYVTCEASVCDASCRCHYVTDHNDDGTPCTRQNDHDGDHENWYAQLTWTGERT